MTAAHVAVSLPATTTQTSHLAGNLCRAAARPLKKMWLIALLLQAFACGVLGGRRHGVVAANVTEQMVTKSETFSPQWLEKYRGEKLGCDAGRGSYVWRHNGFGSNINSESSEEECFGRGICRSTFLVNLRKLLT